MMADESRWIVCRVCVIPMSKKEKKKFLQYPPNYPWWLPANNNMAGTFSATAADWKENYKHSMETELLKKKVKLLPGGL